MSITTSKPVRDGMTADQFRALLEQQFHGSVSYMQAWAKKAVKRHRDKLPVNPDVVKAACATLAYLDSKGLT